MMDLQKAIIFAASAHDGQTRKGKSTPYITHPFTVAMLLKAAGADDTTVAVGLLHDVLEDAPGSMADKKRKIKDTFGEDVLYLVEAESEDKSQSWEVRKSTTIAKLKKENDPRILMIACSDKAANLHEMVLDAKTAGDALWARFNRGKAHTAWYYRNLIRVFETKPVLKELAMLRQLKTDYEALFVSDI